MHATCHDLDMVAAGAGASREVWKGTINEMISYGARIDPEDQAKVSITWRVLSARTRSPLTAGSQTVWLGTRQNRPVCCA